MQFDMNADPSTLRRWLDNPTGISGWWSDKIEGSAGKVGDTFSVYFPSSPVVFQLKVTSASPERIEWHIPESPPWWQGTTIRFDLTKAEGGGTQLLFSHRDFDPENPIIQVITPAWAQFLLNLRAVSESGKPNPAVVN
jgi:hypothetical protein